jgi:quercetin dioxygenase-like cupin family protein
MSESKGNSNNSNSFSSRDFGKVPSQLTPDQPEKLIHQNVLGEVDGNDTSFSDERRHLVRVVDLPSRVLSMTLGGLLPGQGTRLHRHNYETVIYITEGSGYSMIGDKKVTWKKGDAIYVPVWAWHQHVNSSQVDEALYIACENAPMLQNLGIALREES